jgi:hypothetical protein
MAAGSEAEKEAEVHEAAPNVKTPEVRESHA